MQALAVIGEDMLAADAKHNFSSQAPTWAAALTALKGAIEEGQEISRMQPPVNPSATSGNPEASVAELEASLERAVTSVLLWAQSASQAQGGAHHPEVHIVCLAFHGSFLVALLRNGMFPVSGTTHSSCGNILMWCRQSRGHQRRSLCGRGNAGHHKACSAGQPCASHGSSTSAAHDHPCPGW